MRKFLFLILALAMLCASVMFNSRAESHNFVIGDYVEVRTASVFAGACHYNGELTTAGREALMVWNVTDGSWDGIDLKGMRALAVVSSDANLSDSRAARRSELVIDNFASQAQTAALAKALKSRYGGTLGQIVSVKSAPIEFRHEGQTYSVGAPEIAVDVEAMPDDLCCKMPQLIWYEPLVPLAGRKVGYTRMASYAGGAVGDAWQRTGENSAFYGSFSF